MITRRRFIGLIFLILAGFIVAFLSFLSFGAVVRRILRKDLKALKITDDQIDQFISEAEEKGNFAFLDNRKKWLIKVYDRLPVDWVPLPFERRYREYRSQIVGAFLLSTDFFHNGMNEGETIEYIGMYDPYRRPCSNPFSDLYYTAI